MQIPNTFNNFNFIKHKIKCLAPHFGFYTSMELKAFWESTIEVPPRKHCVFTVNCLSFKLRQWFFSISDKNGVPFYTCFSGSPIFALFIYCILGISTVQLTSSLQEAATSKWDYFCGLLLFKVRKLQLTVSLCPD